MRVCSLIRQTRELDDNFIAENHTSAVISEDHTNPSAKRQRRPNVRLEQLGDQHAADKRKNKKGKDQNMGISMSNGGVHRRSSLDVCNNLHRAGNALPVCVEGSALSLPAFQEETNVKNLQRNLKIAGKNVRKGSGKSGVPKMAAAVGQLRYSGCKKKVAIMQEAADSHLDKENSALSPARFEGSEFGDVIFPTERRERGTMVMLHSRENCQSGDYLPALTGVRRERMNHWTQRMQAVKLIKDAGAKRMAGANGSLHVPKGKLVVKGERQMLSTRNKLVLEANGIEESRESSKKNETRTGSRSLLGVREWLQDLGLDKYAEIFEAHEVEPEVLPFLTLDDLREMGVAAVGSRRKLFSAIQHIREAILAQAE